MLKQAQAQAALIGAAQIGAGNAPQPQAEFERLYHELVQLHQLALAISQQIGGALERAHGPRLEEGIPREGPGDNIVSRIWFKIYDLEDVMKALDGQAQRLNTLF